MSYVAGDAESEIDLLDMLGMKWATTPPTEPGWYWAMSRLFQRPVLVLVEYLEGVWCVAYTGDAVRFGDFSYWLGPLPEPAPPVDDNPK